MNDEPSLRPDRRPSLASALLGVLAALASVVLVTACGPEPEAEPVTCSDFVNEAAYQAEPEDEVEWFDRAIETCGSYDEIATAIDKKNVDLGYEIDEFLKKRCQNAETLATTNVCLVASPPTTLVEIVEDPVYVGQTLDGREIEVTPDDVEFDGNEPAIIVRTVELAGTGGSGACTAVLGVRDDFALFVDPEKEGERNQDIASMFAQHAQLVADFIGCISDPVVTGIPPAATPAPPATDGGESDQ